ncbi:MAG TPA: hypothetical protein VMA35_08355 [Candidatus Sulfopaludibacter sp.]|nr:hypothetical protein [Candidatus Sulfopaludibacter sp.]
MKKIIHLAACLLALTLTPVFGQPASQFPPPGSPTFQQRLQTIVNRANPTEDNAPALTKFNLDFRGGSPVDLVNAIEKATGKPLNTIIPTEDADIQLPPLKMNDVVTPQLFAALEAASRKTVAVQNAAFGNTYSQITTDYGFQTSDSPVTDSSIWYFHADKPTLPPVVSNEKICRFYNLDPFLNRGFTVDDITTAIQTGWKMAGISPAPELNYHKETRLLIAFGEPGELQTIQDVLNWLPATSTSHTEINDMKSQINGLESQVDTLTKKVSVLTQAQTALPKEKSGN